MKNQAQMLSVMGLVSACTFSRPADVAEDGAAPTVVLSVTLTSINAGTGTVMSVTPSGFSCTTGTCDIMYNYGASVQLRATPASDTSFAGWSGACTNATGDCIVSMSQMPSVTATFSKICTPTPGGAIHVDQKLGTNDAQHGGAGLGCAVKTLGYALQTNATQVQLIPGDTFIIGFAGEPTAYTITDKKLFCNQASISGNADQYDTKLITVNGTFSEINGCAFDRGSGLTMIKIISSGITNNGHRIVQNTFKSADLGIAVLPSVIGISIGGNTFNSVAEGVNFAAGAGANISSNVFTNYVSYGDVVCQQAQQTGIAGSLNSRPTIGVQCVGCANCPFQ